MITKNQVKGIEKLLAVFMCAIILNFCVADNRSFFVSAELKYAELSSEEKALLSENGVLDTTKLEEVVKLKRLENVNTYLKQEYGLEMNSQGVLSGISKKQIKIGENTIPKDLVVEGLGFSHDGKKIIGGSLENNGATIITGITANGNDKIQIPPKGKITFSSNGNVVASKEGWNADTLKSLGNKVQIEQGTTFTDTKGNTLSFNQRVTYNSDGTITLPNLETIATVNGGTYTLQAGKTIGTEKDYEFIKSLIVDNTNYNGEGIITRNGATATKTIAGNRVITIGSTEKQTIVSTIFDTTENKISGVKVDGNNGGIYSGKGTNELLVGNKQGTFSQGEGSRDYVAPASKLADIFKEGGKYYIVDKDNQGSKGEFLEGGKTKKIADIEGGKTIEGMSIWKKLGIAALIGGAAYLAYSLLFSDDEEEEEECEEGQTWDEDSEECVSTSTEETETNQTVTNQTTTNQTQENECSEKSDCVGGYVCINGTCVTCADDEECGDGYICNSDKVCVEETEEDSSSGTGGNTTQ